MNVPVKFFGLTGYVLGGSGALTFHPTGNAGGAVPGADAQAKAVILYGGGADSGFTRRLALGANTVGSSTRLPISTSELISDAWTYTAEPLGWPRLQFLGRMGSRDNPQPRLVLAARSSNDCALNQHARDGSCSLTRPGSQHPPGPQDGLRLKGPGCAHIWAHA
jgi:hypothetical protein